MTSTENSGATLLGLGTPPALGHATALLGSAVLPRAVETERPTAPRVSLAPPASRMVAVLPGEQFAWALRREMRRADRSGQPLSLVTYRLARGSGAAQIAELRDLLAHSIRETDLLGQVGETSLAVICTDTGDAGVGAFIRKVDHLASDLPYSVESATYPDNLFEGLAQGPGLVHAASPLIATAEQQHRQDTYRLKRAVDVFGALLALIVFSPLMLLTAALVRLTSNGPAIFRQTRLGKNGRPFTFYKFRSMVANNDDHIHREFVTSLIKGEDERMVYKIPRDPRVTWIGRIIRRTSIDELPQLFNVLKGDMSLVGPRPPLPYEAENYRSWHLRRVLDVQPGITGLWQVEGRSKLPFDEMVRLDLRYIRGCSLWLDLCILAKTVPVVLSCDGAN